MSRERHTHAGLALAPRGPPAASPASLVSHFIIQLHPPAGSSLHWPCYLFPLLLGSFRQACAEYCPAPLPLLHLAKTRTSLKLGPQGPLFKCCSLSPSLIHPQPQTILHSLQLVLTHSLLYFTFFLFVRFSRTT